MIVMDIYSKWTPPCVELWIRELHPESGVRVAGLGKEVESEDRSLCWTMSDALIR